MCVCIRVYPTDPDSGLSLCLPPVVWSTTAPTPTSRPCPLRPSHSQTYIYRQSLGSFTEPFTGITHKRRGRNNPSRGPHPSTGTDGQQRLPKNGRLGPCRPSMAPSSWETQNTAHTRNTYTWAIGNESTPPPATGVKCRFFPRLRCDSIAVIPRRLRPDKPSSFRRVPRPTEAPVHRT